MMDKIKALSDKSMIFIGIVLVLIAIIFFIVVSFAYRTSSNRCIDFVYYFLSGIGLVFMAMGYKKKLKSK